jgi:2-amino-4-hydroxy-6-hydroxymethyldihydropteridine diphosphokinase
VTLAYIGLGSNLGRSIETVKAAQARIANLPGIDLLRRSSLYRTAPQGVLDQPDFINAVVEVQATTAPEDLLPRLKGIEVELGRKPSIPWGPRVIDLDLLIYGDVKLSTPELTIPHAEMWDRLFVLAPLAELRPDLHDPGGRAILDVCDSMRDSQRVERLEVR